MLAWLNNIYRLEQNINSWYGIRVKLTPYQNSALVEKNWSNNVNTIDTCQLFSNVYLKFMFYTTAYATCCLHPLMMRVYIPLFLTRFLLIIFDPLFDNHVQWLLLWFVYCNAMGTNNEWVVFWLSHALLHFFHVLK